MTDSGPFTYLNSINETKINLMKDKENTFVEKEYNPFMVNRGLSYFADTILYANEMNKASILDNKMQYEYLLYSIRKRKRRSKWFKPKKQDDIQLIMIFYKYNRIRAEEVYPLITKDQLKTMKEFVDEGGVNKKKKI